MRVLNVRNVHEALPTALLLLDDLGIWRSSRNGDVRVAPWPVTTVYDKPWERVLFWPDRDANPFFHLYESLWMLAGRNDVSVLTEYAANMINYSDDGKTLHGAYGYRWRHYFGKDQLHTIARILRENPDDRRCVLQMWDTEEDLGRKGNDVPCNLIATFQRDGNGLLDMSVFCRSNDIIWGAYGANAVHFAFLQEYLSIAIGCGIGAYSQISVNWHAYRDLFDKLKHLRSAPLDNPYDEFQYLPLIQKTGDPERDISRLNSKIGELLIQVHCGFAIPEGTILDEPFFKMTYHMLKAHYLWKHSSAPERFGRAFAELEKVKSVTGIDWVVAAQQWLLRRFTNWQEKLKSGTKVETKIQ
jgi:Thymidylate synthase